MSVAAALALVGDRARAERVYAAAVNSLNPKPVLEFGRSDYGSSLRDAAAIVSLASEGVAKTASSVSASAPAEIIHFMAISPSSWVWRRAEPGRTA